MGETHIFWIWDRKYFLIEWPPTEQGSCITQQLSHRRAIEGGDEISWKVIWEANVGAQGASKTERKPQQHFPVDSHTPLVPALQFSPIDLSSSGKHLSPTHGPVNAALTWAAEEAPAASARGRGCSWVLICRGGQRVTSPLLGHLGTLPAALHTSSSWQRAPSPRCSLPSCPCPTGAVQTIPFAFPSLPNASPGFWYPHYWRAVDGRGVSIHLHAVSPLLLQPAPSHTHTVLPFLSTIAKFTKHNRRGTNSEVWQCSH